MTLRHKNRQFNLSAPDLSLILLLLFFGLSLSGLALEQHRSFQTHGFDLGNVNQAVWNTAQGRPLAFTNMAPLTNRLALHVEPIFFLFVPFYWLGLGGPEFLLTVQAWVMVLGAGPLYLLARRRLGAWPAVVLAASYLLYPPLSAAALYDFHAVALAPTFYLLAFYGLERVQLAEKAGRSPRRAWVAVAVSLGLAVACKEDMGLTTAMIGLYLILKDRRWRAGGLIFALGMSWSAVCFLLIQPQFAAGGNVQADRYAWLITTLTTAPLRLPAEIFSHLQNVQALGYVGLALLPVLGLALFSPLLLLPTLPTLAINLLSSNPFTWRLEEFHYAAPLAPFIFLATLSTLAYVKNWHSQQSGLKRYFYPALWLSLILVGLGYHYLRGFSPLARPVQTQDRTITAHHQLGWQLADSLQPDIPLLAPLNLNPHVSSRPVLHQDFDDLAPADWLWLDVASLPNENGVQGFIKNDILPAYQVITATDGYLLLKPGSITETRPESPQPLPAEFYHFAYAKKDPQYPLRAQFGENLRLMGLDLHFNRAEEVSVTSYWQRLGPVPPNLQMALYLLDGNGTPIGVTDPHQPPATLVWLPPAEWPERETMVVTFNHLPWFTREMSAHGLAVGVFTADEADSEWNLSARWPPSPIPGPFQLRTPAEGSLLQLASLTRLAGMVEGGPNEHHFAAPRLEVPTDVTFLAAESSFRLAGYSQPVWVADGQAVAMTLAWQVSAAEGATIPRLTRFVHLVGPDGLRGQVDSAPINNTYPTDHWVANEVVLERIILPADPSRPPSAYTLHLGFYSPVSGVRLLRVNGSDSFQIPIPGRN